MKKADYIIREIEGRDNEQMASIIRKVMTEFGCVGSGYSIEDNEVDSMYESYHHEKGVYYVIVDDQNNVFGGAGIDRLEGASPDLCELKKMYFSNEIRGLGLGKEMLAMCLVGAKKMGYKVCYLETVERMVNANALYASFGFERSGDQIGETGHSSCDTFYTLAL